MEILKTYKAGGYIGNKKPVTNAAPEKLLPIGVGADPVDQLWPADMLLPANFNEAPVRLRLQDAENEQIEKLLPPGMNPCLDC